MVNFMIISFTLAPPINSCRSHYERHAYLLDEERSAMLTNMAAGKLFALPPVLPWLLASICHVHL